MMRFLVVFLVTTSAVSLQGQIALRDAITQRIARDSGAVVGVAFRDLASGDTLFIGADASFHAASTMKLPVMIELYRQAEQGGLPLTQDILLVNRFASIADSTQYSLDASEDGDTTLYARVGTRVPVRELMQRMIVRSSNLATNVLIALVGADRVNATAQRLGATRIRVLRGVEDNAAYRRGMNNTTTARDLAILLNAIASPGLVSDASRAEMRDVLLAQEFNDEIPAGLPPGTKVAHKTGWITGVLHDAAIVYPDSRPPYILVVLTRNIPDDKVARTLIADIARLVHASALATSAR
jgi:beta-lactamase class A